MYASRYYRADTVQYRSFSRVQRCKARAKVTELGGMMSRGAETEVNWGAVVEDWHILGSGLVKSIVCKDVEQFL
jgi:hypothetical protein